jgi:4-hydroxy-3-methylbut-2-enyl diphosphate reductase IspH
MRDAKETTTERTKDGSEQSSEMVFSWLHNVEDIEMARKSRAHGVAAASQGLARSQDTNIADSTCCVCQLVVQRLVIEKLSQNFKCGLEE